MQAAITFFAESFLLDGPKLMGRQSTGHGYLRAAVAAAAGAAMPACVTDQANADAYIGAVRAIDPASRPYCLAAAQLEELAGIGTLYRPDPGLAIAARARLRVGAAAYSLCGVTHTIASQNAADLLTDLAVGPVMPWDALVCTSQAAAAAVTEILGAQAEYLRWRFGPTIDNGLMLPVIPLGLHCRDFDPSAEGRAAARQEFAIDDDEIVFLSAGRLSFAGKSHPVVAYEALQRLAAETGRRVTLIQAGQAANAFIADAYRSETAAFAPDVRALFVDGNDAAAYARCWAAADVFLSLSDSYQETFGLTPVEAMASGLPVVVTDWNGYKDTVRDGLDGFRIRTFAPSRGVGEAFARAFECGQLDYGAHMSRLSYTVSIDRAQLWDRLALLASDPDLRRRLGEAGRVRALAHFDWAIVYRRYQGLWAEQQEVRKHAAVDPAWAARLATTPRVAPQHGDAYRTFAAYPTLAIDRASRVSRPPDASAARFAQLITHPMIDLWQPGAESVGLILDALAGGPLDIVALERASGIAGPALIEIVARLAKLGLLAIDA